MRKPHLIHLVYLIHLMALPLMAQGTGEADLPRLTGTIRLDGVLDDEAWRSVAPLPLTMYLPTFRGAPSESTEIRVAYDAEFIYACGRFHDSDPAHMRVNSLYRDRYSGDDAFGFYLDTFNDNENGVWFITNPAGTRVDNSISGDGAVTDVSWNVAWDVATKIDGQGWTFEMRIPLSSLRFQERESGAKIGMVSTGPDRDQTMILPEFAAVLDELHR